MNSDLVRVFSRILLEDNMLAAQGGLERPEKTPRESEGEPFRERFPLGFE